ncbi:42211_t:CDS:1 [Gigaspora margarita]|uniref:42211_t:CDS:1 n=1 Tax=Gigaspora margarita TaxID=4874 RepID=A0ABN7XBS6_GIGMA|nr:42211_t:CDS:1 [Gigaspora margarita]
MNPLITISKLSTSSGEHNNTTAFKLYKILAQMLTKTMDRHLKKNEENIYPEMNNNDEKSKLIKLKANKQKS